MSTTTLPTHLGGYQHLEPDVIPKSDDILVRNGMPFAFFSQILADVPETVGETEETRQCRVYRLMPVAKQSDSHERDVAQVVAQAGGCGASLPSSAAERKRIPIATGVLDYFPLAIAEIAKVSLAGNNQHNPGSPLHWDRSKSGDESDALMRHFLERGKRDTDGQLHSAKLCWRACALLQKELEGMK